ncbi:ABC transporter ATP-binding protein [Dietzia sp. WMMA184]|uniref:ABC transporter ATP-binding protein n=1 Tax=Dietzia sp. WMMA184 TaxID=2039808 RepID=UPI00135890A0|nr:ABC transporter ATP-binding protein [Dietzia sp. WMMA184]
MFESAPHASPEAEITIIATDLEVTYDSFTVHANRSSKNPLKRVGLVPSRSIKRAVHDATIVARAGERIGLVGRNGSGKSTILRALAGLEPITAGSVFARSQPVLLGVSPALIPERTGYENIELGCLAMGLTPDQVETLLPEIAELADLGRELNDPINTYSSGMGSRLRFAIAAVNPNTDILLIDEALGTGDAAFQDRSEAAIERIVSNAGTIFFVSHVPSAVVKMCRRAIWMFEGTPIMDGSSKRVARTYQRWSRLTVAREYEAAQRLVDEVREAYEPPRIDLP